MNPIIHFSCILHIHQPVGNHEKIFQRAFDKAYRPLLECLGRHPGIRIGYHISGCLWDWLESRHPDYLEQVARLEASEQIELLSAGYYEPILPPLSHADKLGQIEKLNVKIRTLTGRLPRGLWLTERVWEPHLPKILKEAHIRYVVLDDAHFFASGFTEDELYHPFLTEEEGSIVTILPSLKRLRYLIPFAPLEELLRWLDEIRNQPRQPFMPPVFLCMGDDGEKFGLWPRTYKRCWEEGYMDRLFDTLEKLPWIECVRPSDYLDQYGSFGLAYLPSASYEEMTTWALPPELSCRLQKLAESIPDEDPVRNVVRGGHWRHFLVRYPEANWMMKRTARLSRKIQAMVPTPEQRRAREHVWSAQCSCGYWHGVFGGIYLGHIRDANYAHILEAERFVSGKRIQCHQEDMDSDGNQELSVYCPPYSAHFSPFHGGSLRELSHLPSRAHLTNVVTRRPEAYHEELRQAVADARLVTPEMDQWSRLETIHSHTVRAKETGLETILFADWYRRTCFLDHILRDDADLDGFWRCSYPEEGDFVNLGYGMGWHIAGESVVVNLRRDGHAWVHGRFQPLSIEKIFRFQRGSNQFQVDYTLENAAEQPFCGRFGIETCSGYYGQIEIDGTTCPSTQTLEHRSVTRYTLTVTLDPGNELGGTSFEGPFLDVARPRKIELTLQLDRPATLWCFPLEQVVKSEEGFERTYQGVTFLQWWPVEISPGHKWSVRLRWETRPR